MNRRGFLKGLVSICLTGLFVAGYAVFGETIFRLRVQRWRVSPKGWTAGPLTIAVVADVHVGEPWVSLARVKRVVAATNALGADLIVFAGDLEAGHRFVTRKVPLEDAAQALGGLKARLGVHAILGNHDWWHDEDAQKRGAGPTRVGQLLAAAGLQLYENRAVKIGERTGGFWLAGLADQLAIGVGPAQFRGLDDLPGTMAQITDAAPVILLAHEPDIFAEVTDRVALTISGHTHGGQVRFFGWSPVVPSKYGNRYAYGVVDEGSRTLVVSGGIGCSIAPIRVGVPPEITVIEILPA